MYLILLIVTVVSLDQWSKWAIKSSFSLYQSKPIIQDFFHFTYVTNEGMAFGLELRDDITFTVSKLRWETLVGNNSDLVAERPQEGDLVYFPTTRAFFEIQFVEHEQPFYQQSALPTYKLSCTKWEYSSERVDTGIATIDSVEDSLSTDTMNFQFTLENEVGSVVLESSIGAIDYIINEDFTMATQSTGDQGQIFETAAGTNTSSTADDILDFSERNPFGEVDEY